MISSAWLVVVGTPYFWGGKPGDPRGLDCSGLVEIGWRAGGVWPFQGDASASMMWESLPRVAWEERLAGDLVCYGNGGIAHHVVGVLDSETLIGANHGGPPHDGETEAAYVARMAAQGAKVVVCPSSYWASKRLGVVRAPALL